MFKLPESVEARKHLAAFATLISIIVFVAVIIVWPVIVVILILLMVGFVVYWFAYQFVSEVFFDQ